MILGSKYLNACLIVPKTLFTFCAILYIFDLNLKSQVKVIPKSFSSLIVQFNTGAHYVLPEWRIQAK